jgi:hypothetical protein
MDRVSGWYLRRTKLTLFALGLFLAIGANVDFLGYAQRMISDAQARQQAATYALMLGDERFQTRIGDLLEQPAEGRSPPPPR